jgi:hypothetical protein
LEVVAVVDTESKATRIYRQPGLTLDREIAQVGGELGGGWRHRSTRPGSTSDRTGSTSTSASPTWPAG